MIPFVDLKAQYQRIQAEVTGAIGHVLEQGQFVLGPEVTAFEAEFAAYCGARHAVGVNSGTSALHLALLAAGVGPGDEVITTPFTFVATAAAICYTGARPVYVDIDPETYTLDHTRLEAAIGRNTRAILPVHLHGLPAEMAPLLAVAARHGLPVIEDAAQAHGARYGGQMVGALGDMGCFSFYPGKNLGAYGEGGMVVTNDAAYAHTLGLLRDWGQEQKYHHILQGYNYRLEELQAAVLRVKLRYLEGWTEARRAHAALYDELLAQSELQTPARPPHMRHVYHVYAIRTQGRFALQQALGAEGIQTGIHYPIPVHLQVAYHDPRYRRGDFPVAEQVADEVLSLPMYAELTPAQIAEVAEVVCHYAGTQQRAVGGLR